MAVRFRSTVRRFLGNERGLRVMGAVAIGLCLAILVWSRALAPLDRQLSDWRFSQAHWSASEELVFVEIDGAALESIGVWPWPRAVYADLIDRLIAAGAYDVWVDVDFSAASTPANDAALAEALQAAGGYVYLAAFQRAEEGRSILSLPRPQFLEHADPFSVNVTTDALGIVRSIPAFASDGVRVIASLSSILFGTDAGTASHGIDYGLRAETIPTISARALLEGSADAERITGRRVVVGASALELADYFFTPNQGPLPGAVIQILAAETALADRSPSALSVWWPFGAALLLLGLQAMLPIKSIRVRAACLALSSIFAEALALLVYFEGAIIVPTIVFHVGTATLLLGTLILDTRFLAHMADRMSGERDAFRAMLEQVIADNYDGVLIVRPDGQIVSASQFAKSFLGQDLVGRRLDNLLPPPVVADAKAVKSAEASIQGQIELGSTRGRREIEYVVTHSSYGSRDRAITTVTFRDITERLRNERTLTYLAEHDPITKTLSRSGFLKRMQEKAAQAGQADAMFVVQLKRFKAITASLGHEAGDQLLAQFADRLSRRGLGPLAHLGQAQFAVAASRHADAEYLFEEMKLAIKASFDLGGHSAMVGMNAGYAAPLPDEKAEQCLRRAEAALVSLGRGTPGKLARYTEAQAARVSANRQVESQLVRALEDDEFFLLFQPQIELGTGRTIGAEALVRWRRAGTVVPPGDFLPVAEETGLIVDMTRIILLQACRTAISWDERMRVAVNISALHFELGDLVADVRSALAKTGLPAHRLELEITETATVSGRQRARAVLRQLREMGITIAIDDFGTGHSSLAYLDQLPFDVIKIDKSFIDRLEDPAASYGIISGIIGIAHSMGKKVLAEGIEHKHQAELLARLGCEFGQGYYWSKPGEGSLLAKKAA